MESSRSVWLTPQDDCMAVFRNHGQLGLQLRVTSEQFYRVIKVRLVYTQDGPTAVLRSSRSV